MISVMAGTVILLASLFDEDAGRGLFAPGAATASPSSSDGLVERMAANWNGEIAFSPAYAALTPLADDVENASARVFNPLDDYSGLPRSEGVETVAAYCSGCHSLSLVMQQRQSREGWDHLLDWMAAEQGMAEPPPEMRAEILDYLSREFGVE